MRSKVLWTTVSAVVLALSVASVALAATKDDSSASPAPQTRGAACGALLDDPAAADELQALCTEHRADMQAWFDAYGADRTSADAQAALAELRTEHRTDMQALLEKYGIDASRCTGGGMMGGGYGAGNGCGMAQAN
jgi:hypothetical protein